MKPRRSSFKLQFKTRDVHKIEPILDLKKLEEAGEMVGPVSNNDNEAVLLSPIRRKAYAKRYVAHMITNTFMIADYDSGSDKKAKGNEKIADPGMDYLPKARDKGRPNARGGSIMIEPQAPSDRLDKDLQVDELLTQIKKMNLEQVLDALGIRPLHRIDPNKPMTSRTIKPAQLKSYLKSCHMILLLDKFQR